MVGKRNGVGVCLVVCLSGYFVWAGQIAAQQQQQANEQPAASALVRVLQAKGILTAEDVAQLGQATSPSDADQRLMKLLLSKGVISQADYAQMTGGTGLVNASSNGSTSAAVVPTVYRVPPANAGAPAAPGAVASSSSASAAPTDPNDPSQAQYPPPPQQQGSVSPTTLPAAMPVRVFPVGGLTKGELTPAIKLAGVGITPYGFLKATFIHDSSSPGGDDFPLPGFLGDSGPTAAGEFHVKARSTRLGTNFEWLDSNPSLVVTGKFEMDFEGNFNRSDNRNLSSIRSYNPSIRLAYGRIDYHVTPNDNINFVFGQDWTPFGSSTLPNMLETTGLGVAFGDIYERAPQFRVGYTHNFGSFQLMAESAMVLPAIGDTPAAANLFNQLGYGERQGPDSDQPQVEGRVVGQFQLDHARGVAPAQLIMSWQVGRRTAIVLGSAITAPTAPGAFNFHTAFPRGVTVGSPTNGADIEWQLPTRWLTLVGKAYTGSDLRYYFGSQLFSYYTNTTGLTGIQSFPSIDGASTVSFGLNSLGQPVLAPEDPVRGRGGFAQIGFPISRWFGRDPEGRNAGWSLYGMYGTDQANTRDVAHLAASDCSPGAPAGCGRIRSDMTVGTLNYKLNKWVSFSFEESLYRTRANTDTAQFPLFEGVHQHEWRDLRSEGGAIFSF